MSIASETVRSAGAFCESVSCTFSSIDPEIDPSLSIRNEYSGMSFFVKEATIDPPAGFTS